MKKIIFTIVLLIFGISNSLLCEEYHQNTIIVKFKQNSDLLNLWVKSNRNGEIQSFSPIIGSNSSQPYISNDLLKKLDNSYKNNKLQAASGKIQSLKNIATIKYQMNIDANIAAKKIQSFPDVEYAEIFPKHKLLFKPNDPRLGEQYYLNVIRVYEAWDLLDSYDSVLVAVVDTGVDFLHEDLSNTLFINPGEDGLDELGNSRRTNLIDDDDNGFIDDFMGWDFASSSNPNIGDNDPTPGHIHGTHVAGVIAAETNNEIGIAGIAKNVRYLPVKIGPDNPFSTNVLNGYQGILYAALMGADVINCSWGSSSFSYAEQEVIDVAVASGSVVVAAAGNDNLNRPLYPAAYKGALSVAAVNEQDYKAIFSNFHNSIGISAPGTNIVSTVPGDIYMPMDGTSMATPIVSGVAALLKLKYPDFTTTEIIETLKATSVNIDHINSEYIGFLGRGRVDAYNALSTANPISIVLVDYNFLDENNDNIFDINENIELEISLRNILSIAENVHIKATANSYFDFDFAPDSIYIGTILKNQTIKIPNPFRFKVPDNIPLDYVADFYIDIYENNRFIVREVIPAAFRPSFRTISGNNITTTINSVSNIGFNDYPVNQQGVGFLYKDNYNVLFESGLIVGTGYRSISNQVRGLSQMRQDKSFLADYVVTVTNPGNLAFVECDVQYRDLNLPENAKVIVNQKVYQFNEAQYSDFIIVSYDVINKSLENFDSLFVGLFFDWDIGPAGAYNQSAINEDNYLAYVENVNLDNYPIIGTKMLSNHLLNFFAIDNNGSSQDNPGIYDGFTREEKWRMITGGLQRVKSSITDVSFVISAGPIKLLTSDTARISFAIIASNTMEQLNSNAEIAFELAQNLNIADLPSNALPDSDKINKIFPNPTGNNLIHIDFSLIKSSTISLDIVDVEGKTKHNLLSNKFYPAGRFVINYYLHTLSQGKYFIRLTTENNISSKPLIFVQ